MLTRNILVVSAGRQRAWRAIGKCHHPRHTFPPRQPYHSVSSRHQTALHVPRSCDHALAHGQPWCRCRLRWGRAGRRPVGVATRCQSLSVCVRVGGSCECVRVCVCVVCATERIRACVHVYQNMCTRACARTHRASTHTRTHTRKDNCWRRQPQCTSSCPPSKCSPQTHSLSHGRTSRQPSAACWSCFCAHARTT